MAALTTKKINLALQGGGSHGAFTWGVLDRLLDEPRLEIEAVSGTSAGAMNAVALAEGFYRDGRAGAQQSLRRFWEGVAASTGLSAASSFWSSFFDPMGIASEFSAQWASMIARSTSPYLVNPLNINPLRDVLEDIVDFECVRACSPLALYIAATNVETGRTRIFERAELTADHILASACLPFVFQAVEIDGAPYWDGGYVGNPPLFPFFYQSESRDILVVQINPKTRPGAPTTSQAILDRMTEITFNSSLLREYRNIAFVNRQLNAGALPEDKFRAMLLHRVDGGAALSDLSAATRLAADPRLFSDLFQRGREAADDWLTASFDKIGNEATLDLDAVLSNPDLGI